MKWLAPIALAVTLVACGGQIDSDKLEADIRRDAANLEEPLVLDDVDCPSEDLEEGDAFTCTLTIKGQDTELEVVQIDDDGTLNYDDLPTLAEGPAGTDIAADEASVGSVLDAVNKDVTALCDYATPDFRKEIASQENCAKAVLANYESPLLENYEIFVDGDDAGASADGRTVTLARQKNGSWLITGVR
jgi:hypothetical protein